MSWLSGWTYRKAVTLSRESGVVTNYQMKLLVGESSGATGENVDCGGLCLSTFNDLRFTTSDGTTLLDYWIESVTGTTPNQLATIWVECDSIGTSATTFYMYYGKADATSVSSGLNTFPFFDDFNGSSLDTDKWTDLGGTTEADGVLVATATANNEKGITGKTAFGSNYALRCRVKPTHYNNTAYLEVVRFQLADNSKQYGTYFCHVNSDNNAKHLNYSIPNKSASAISGVTANTYCLLDIIRNAATNVTYKINDGNSVAITNYLTDSNMLPGILCYANGSTITTDWILIRNFLATEPAWGTWSAVEVKFATNYLHARRDRMNMRPVSTQNCLEQK